MSRADARKLDIQSVPGQASERKETASHSWRLLRSGSFFFVANVVAGVFNYIFQIFASKDLSGHDFSNLYGWFADLSLFFMVSGVLQYASNFYPARRIFMRRAVVAINVFCLILAAAWFQFPAGQGVARAMMIVSGSTLFGWLMGQIQYRRLFVGIGLANILITSVKMAIIFLPILEVAERYRFAMFASYLPALWLLSIFAWQIPDQTSAIRLNRFSWKLWAAPVVLSVTGAIIPQLDMVLIARIQPAAVFENFARASLFYKGIYFAFLIFAQWLLPHQIHGEWNGAKKKISALWLAAMALMASAGITFVSPWVVQIFLKWDQVPPAKMIFLSCLNMSLLTWIFLMIQEACARTRTQVAALSIAVLGFEAALQLAGQWSIDGYFTASILCQVFIIWMLSAPHGARQILR